MLVLDMTNDNKTGFSGEIEAFIKHVDSINELAFVLVLAVQNVTKSELEKLHKFEGENCEIVETEEERNVKIPSTSFRKWKKLKHSYERFELARSLLPRSLLVSLISQYDAYLGRLLRAIFVNRPEILNGSDRKISLENLSQFSSIESAREYLLEKEVEGILRLSHTEQFKWMERTFDLPLTKGLNLWPTFVELTERRNLFVHTDGMASSQYMAVCKLHKCSIGNVKEGERLDVSQDYFEISHQCMYEIGVKLGHVLWRKLFPNERDAADASLISIGYELIDNGDYELAIRILDFSCTEIKKFSNEARQFTLIVNRAQAYKWHGDDEKCRHILSSIDWSAKGNSFKLANAVLTEDWGNAAGLMKIVGATGSVRKADYQDWPLFKDFRKQKVFLETFRQVFGENFEITSESKIE